MIVAQAGAIPLLVKMLRNETQGGRAAAASALCNLSFNEQNEDAIIQAGAISRLKALTLTGTRMGRYVST